MRDHFEAIKTLLAPLGRQVHVIQAPGSPTYPYFMLWGLPGELGSDGLDGEQKVVSDLLRVSSVGKTVESVMELRRLSRPLLIEQRPIVAGRFVHPLRMTSAEEIQPDEDVTMPDTNRHPSFGVDIYRLISEPA